MICEQNKQIWDEFLRLYRATEHFRYVSYVYKFDLNKFNELKIIADKFILKIKDYCNNDFYKFMHLSEMELKSIYTAYEHNRRPKPPSFNILDAELVNAANALISNDV